LHIFFNLCLDLTYFLLFSIRRQTYLKLQYNVQRFSLKHLQKLESNKSLSAKNDKDQQMQLRQAQKDYYELFEALAERERSQGPAPVSPFQGYLQQQPQGQYGSSSPGLATTSADGLASAPKPAGHPADDAPAFRTLHFDEKKSDSEEDGYPEVRLDDFVPGRRPSRAIDALNAPSIRITTKPPLTPIVTSGDMMTPGNPEAIHDAFPTPADIRAFSNLKRTGKTPTAANPGAGNSARSVKLSRRGLSAKFDEEGNLQSLALKPMPSVVHAHDGVYHSWALRSLNNIPVHKAMATSMSRAEEITKDHNAFCKRFDQECRRSFDHVQTLSGILEVTPMQALHLPETKNPMLVRVSYGETVSEYTPFRFPLF
jgi:hypothetical protein